MKTRLQFFLTASGTRAATAGLMVVRTKIIALLLGAEGIGLLGLYTATQEIAAQAADLGLSHSAVREIARARDAPNRIATLRRALTIAVIVLGVLGAALVWALSGSIAQLVTGSIAHSDAFGILAIGVLLTVLMRWRQAVLTGYGQLGQLAIGVVAGSAAATAVGGLAVWHWGMHGLIWAVLAAPALGLAALLFAGRAVPRTAAATGAMGPVWRNLAQIGVSLMLIALTALIAPMVLRVWLTHQSGLAAAGLFQAAWVVYAHATTVLLASVSMDFYPRISAQIANRQQAGICLENQIRLLLRIGGPSLMLAVGLAPWMMPLLYSDAFSAAVPLVQGLLLAGFARLLAAPLETVLTASGRSRLVLGVSLTSLAITIGAVWLVYPHQGMTGIGLAFALGSCLQLIGIAVLAYHHTGLCAAPRDWLALACVAAGAGALTMAPALATIAASAFAFFALGPGTVEAIYRFFGFNNSAGRRASAALNRLKVWLT